MEESSYVLLRRSRSEEVEEKNIPARPLVFLKRRKRKREERFVQTKTDASINFSATNFKEQIGVTMVLDSTPPSDDKHIPSK
eukprot:scaffold14455_cov96-Skeletonema_dohrnii-CCMP3373.AAC.8